MTELKCLALSLVMNESFEVIRPDFDDGTMGLSVEETRENKGKRPGRASDFVALSPAVTRIARIGAFRTIPSMKFEDWNVREGGGIFLASADGFRLSPPPPLPSHPFGI